MARPGKYLDQFFGIIDKTFIKYMHFKKVPNSMREGSGPSNKKNSQPSKRSQPKGGRGVWRGWDGFPSFSRFLVQKPHLNILNIFENSVQAKRLGVFLA